MSPTRIIALKEFRSAFRDRIFLIIVLLFMLLSIVSVYIGSATKNAELSAYHQIVNMLKTQGETQFPPKPVLYPLAVLKNIIDYISMVGAILAIFLGFNTINGERKQGSLKLLLSRPLLRDQLISGKLTGGALVIGLLLFFTLFFNIILFIVVSGLMPAPSDIGRLVVFILLSFLYMMSFYTAAVFVSIRTRESSFGFLVLMIGWVVITFVIPQLAESQKAFAYTLNVTAQTITQLPADTTLSKTIEIFSPAVQYGTLGRSLLETVPDTASSGLLTVLFTQLSSIIYMLVPGVLLLFGCYASFRGEGETRG